MNVDAKIRKLCDITDFNNKKTGSSELYFT